MDATDDPSTPTRVKGKRIRLRSLMDVREEMARVYRDMRSEKINTTSGNGLVQALMYLAKVTEVVQGRGLLERLEKLEGQRVSDSERSPAPPSH
jgi:hypothetical protein